MMPGAPSNFSTRVTLPAHPREGHQASAGRDKPGGCIQPEAHPPKPPPGLPPPHAADGNGQFAVTTGQAAVTTGQAAVMWRVQIGVCGQKGVCGQSGVCGQKGVCGQAGVGGQKGVCGQKAVVSWQFGMACV
jgi:hypothetical protein